MVQADTFYLTRHAVELEATFLRHADGAQAHGESLLVNHLAEIIVQVLIALAV